MSLIEVKDVEDYMAKAIRGGLIAAASVICDRVVAELEFGFLGRALDLAAHTETLPVYPEDTYLELTYTPVVSISAVAVDGIAQDALSWSIEHAGLQLFRTFSPLGVSPSTATVTYVGGLGEPARSVGRGICLARAARVIDKLMNDELGLERITVEGYSATWLAEDTFTDAELKQVKRWKRRGYTGAPRPLNLDVSATGFYDPFATRY